MYMLKIPESGLEGENAALARGAIDGALTGSAIVAPTWYLLNRRWPAFRALPYTVKTLGAIIIIAPLVSIRAEHRGLEFHRRYRTGIEKTELEREREEERKRWASLNAKEKLAEWTAKHQLSVIVGSWALTMGLVGNKVMRDPLMTMPNKIVQVRLWAQGLTIGVIIATAALTHSQRVQAANMRKYSPDHTWAYVLDEQRLEKERAQRA
ncbi:hypothetical protein DEU56DRAFT_766727 [Suillus clintonianus]|uniref:uncharacterized protein n=1 Tax=Suillus clintonianus TaxID=1904413 RepID=UPI001B86A264|nr:uncharacterized protein DEU56DRAFT_766727 [Suillus clintonianus]KAG2156361.1 hypothetical protein DEU56DRAFT_766727 [Suillus clintonianus]